MNNNSRPSISELLKSQNIQFSKDFFDSLNAVPHPYRKPIVEMILDNLDGFQKQKLLIQSFKGVVYAPYPCYFSLLFENSPRKNLHFYSVHIDSPDGFIDSMVVYGSSWNAHISLQISWWNVASAKLIYN